MREKPCAPTAREPLQDIVDDYLLAGHHGKSRVLAALLANRSPLQAAAPFYRALEVLGTRAADEAIIALRLVLAGRQPSDSLVRRVRALARLARAATAQDFAAIGTVLRGERATLADVTGTGASAAPAKALALAKKAYFREVAGEREPAGGG